MLKNECQFRLPIEEHNGRIAGTGFEGLLGITSIWLTRNFSHGCLYLIIRGADIPGCYYPEQNNENCPYLKHSSE